jgi:hypothetical protein
MSAVAKKQFFLGSLNSVQFLCLEFSTKFMEILCLKNRMLLEKIPLLEIGIC